MRPGRAPSGFQLWFEEHLDGRVVPAGGIAAVAILVLMYMVGYLPERVAAFLVASAVVLVACGYAARRLLESSRTASETILALFVSCAAFVTAGIPIATALLPGPPEAKGALERKGDSLVLPTTVRGPIRILMHGTLEGAGPAQADVTLGAGAERLLGHITRKKRSVRIGRRRATVLREHNSQYLFANLANGVDRLIVQDMRGPLRGPLEVSVFVEPLPLSAEIGIALLLLCVAAALTARSGSGGSSAAALGTALFFGLIVHRLASPEEAVRPEIGALILSTISGASAGSIMTSVARRLFRGWAALSRSP